MANTENEPSLGNVESLFSGIFGKETVVPITEDAARYMSKAADLADIYQYGELYRHRVCCQRDYPADIFDEPDPRNNNEFRNRAYEETALGVAQDVADDLAKLDYQPMLGGYDLRERGQVILGNGGNDTILGVGTDYPVGGEGHHLLTALGNDLRPDRSFRTFAERHGFDRNGKKRH